MRSGVETTGDRPALSSDRLPLTAYRLPFPRHFQKQLVARLHLRQAVAAEFFDQRRGHFERHDVFDDHAGRRTRRSTSLRSYAALSGCFVSRLIDSSGLRSVLIGFFAARTTSGWPLVMPASRPPALFVGRTKPRLGVSRCALVELNRIVNFRARPPGRFEAQADFDAFDRLHRHHRLRQAAVELAIPLGVRAQAERQPFDAHFDDAAQRVAFLAGGVDQLLELRRPARD